MRHASLMSMKFGCLFMLALFMSGGAFAQKQKAVDSTILHAISQQRFTFSPQQMLPMSGRMRQVTPDFFVKVTADTLVSYLPYFGRAYTVSPDASRGPLDFTLTKFSYDRQVRKKGGWVITIKPTESRDVQQYVFTVFDNGTASLQVSSTNRQPISYNGYVKPIK